MKSRERLQNVYGLLKRAIVPGLKYSQTVYEDVLNAVIPQRAVWLDVGCGHHMLPPWRLEQERELTGRAEKLVGLDVDLPSLIKHRTISKRVCGVADNLPFEDEFFDAATANMVVEHLDDPRTQFAEINRVLKPGARFTFHTPNERGYFAVARRLLPGKLAKKAAAMLDGRGGEDVFEVHYKANSQEKIERIADETNFEVEQIRFVSSDAVCAIVPPLAVAELVWIRLLMAKSLRRLRTNLIVTLRKKGTEETA